MPHDKNYGNKSVQQPGGGPNARIRTSDTTVSNPGRSRKIVTGSPRLGPAYLGGNKPTAGMLNRKGR